MAAFAKNGDIRKQIIEFEKRTEDMHLEFYKFFHGEETKMPNWEQLERELIIYSKRRLFDTLLRNELDRILYKFQNRKKIWFSWIEELHKLSDKDTGEKEESES
jgi:hypothetical protein